MKPINTSTFVCCGAGAAGGGAVGRCAKGVGCAPSADCAYCMLSARCAPEAVSELCAPEVVRARCDPDVVAARCEPVVVAARCEPLPVTPDESERLDAAAGGMPFIGVGKAGAETRTPLEGDGAPGGADARAPCRGVGLPDGVTARTALCVITALRGGEGRGAGGASACVSGAWMGDRGARGVGGRAAGVAKGLREGRSPLSGGGAEGDTEGRVVTLRVAGGVEAVLAPREGV